MKNFNNLISLLIIFGAAKVFGEEFKYTEVDLKGSCPKINYINNLDFSKLLGWYYRVGNSFDNPLCYNNEGQTTYTSQYDDKVINVQLCCRSAANPSVAICGSKIGTGTVTATSNPGELIYEFDNNKYNIYIIDTDYENFTVVYGCKPGSQNYGFHRRHGCGENPIRDELIFIFTRGYTLSKRLEKRVRDVLKRNGSDFSNAKPSKQGSSIPYTPNNPKPCDRRNDRWHVNA